MIRRLLKSVLLAVMVFALFSWVALAAWEYMFPITVADTSNTTRNYYPTMLGFGGQPLVDSGKISSNGTDTDMQIASTSIKYMMSTTNVTAVIPILPSSGIASLSLYTGYSPVQSGFPIITGSGGYVTVSDNASLEVSANFTAQASGYVDTSSGATKNLIYKNDGFKNYVSGSANITSEIQGASATADLLPDSAGDYTNIDYVTGAATHWEAVDDPVGAPDDNATYVSTNITGAQQKDAYNLQTVSMPADSVISSVTVYFRCGEWGPNAGTAYPYLRLGGVETAGTPQVISDSAYTTYNETLNRPGGGSWTSVDFADLQVAIGLVVNNAASQSRCTQIYVDVAYIPKATVTVATVSSGIRRVETTANVTHMVLSVYDASNNHQGNSPQSVALVSVTANNTANNWTFLQNNVMPYADNITISVNGVQQLYLAPLSMITGATVPDRSGQTHNGTITWGSNSGVAISYGEMTSYESYVASINATSGFEMPIVPLPSSWFASGGGLSSLPFYDSFSEVSAQTGQPVQTLYSFGVIGLAFGVFIGVVVFTRSALMAYIAMVMVFGFGASMTIISGWIVFAMIIVGGGIMYLYKQVAY